MKKYVHLEEGTEAVPLRSMEGATIVVVGDTIYANKEDTLEGVRLYYKAHYVGETLWKWELLRKEILYKAPYAPE